MFRYEQIPSTTATHHCSIGEQIGSFDILMPNSALEDRGDRWKPGHQKNVWFFFCPNQHISCAAHRVPRPHPSNSTPTTPTLVTFFEKLSFLLRSCLGAPVVPCFLALKNGTVLKSGVSNLPAGRFLLVTCF